jgi:hypothetical protein
MFHRKDLCFRSSCIYNVWVGRNLIYVKSYVCQSGTLAILAPRLIRASAAWSDARLFRFAAIRHAPLPTAIVSVEEVDAARIEPDKSGCAQRTFECPRCHNQMTEVTDLEKAA